MSIKETVQVEKAILGEARKLYQRNPDKYGSRVLKWYLFSLATPTDCETATLARSSYYLLRVIDDVLDLDREPPDGSTPLEFAQELRYDIVSARVPGDPEIARLTNFTLDALERRARPGDDVRGDFASAIDEMVFDYVRADGRIVLPADGLENYFRTSFTPLVNIMLIGLGSKKRAKDLPQLASLQTRLYAVRDFMEDWKKGLINLPLEVLHQANLTSSASFDQVRLAPEVNEWLKYQDGIGRREIGELRNWMRESGVERLPRLMINSQINKVTKISLPNQF